MGIIHQQIVELSDSELMALIRELEHATKVRPEPNQMLYHYIMQCLYPWGGGQRVNIDKNKIIPNGLLSRKIGKLTDSSVYQVCEEIARIQGQNCEMVVGMSLYVFINRYIFDFDKKPKRKPHNPIDWL